MAEPEELQVLEIATLAEGMPGLTPACGTHLGECAAVCLEEKEHSAGVTLQVSGSKHSEFCLNWDTVTEQQRRCYNDLQEATERGAYALSILLMRELTGLVVVERSKKGPGFDYWLGEADDDDLFAGKVRLEVSGLLEGTASEVRSRIKQKKSQVKPSDTTAPAYVGIVEFSRPQAHVELKKVI